MGDRANVRVTSPGAGDVNMYTHHGGDELPGILQRGILRAIVAGKDDDPEYFARIIFCEMVRESGDGLDGTTGVGLGGRPTDGQNKVLTVDVGNNEVVWPDGRRVTVGQYANTDNPSWSAPEWAQSARPTFKVAVGEVGICPVCRGETTIVRIRAGGRFVGNCLDSFTPGQWIAKQAETAV